MERHYLIVGGSRRTPVCCWQARLRVGPGRIPRPQFPVGRWSEALTPICALGNRGAVNLHTSSRHRQTQAQTETGSFTDKSRCFAERWSPVERPLSTCRAWSEREDSSSHAERQGAQVVVLGCHPSLAVPRGQERFTHRAGGAHGL